MKANKEYKMTAEDMRRHLFKYAGTKMVILTVRDRKEKMTVRDARMKLFSLDDQKQIVKVEM